MANGFEKENALLEKGLAYRYWRKAEERPLHAIAISQAADRPKEQACGHEVRAYGGPPHAPLPRRWVCLLCREAASEDEIRERGYDFNHVPDFILYEIFDARLKMRRTGKVLFVARS